MANHGGAGERAAGPKVTMTEADFLSGELPTLCDIVTFCSNLPMSLYADSTGVKSPEVVFRGLVLSRNRLVAEEYLLNWHRSPADMGVVIGTNNYGLPMAVTALANRDLEEDQSSLIRLPAYQPIRAPLGSVVRSRRSVRRFSGSPLPLRDLSTILFHAAGVSGRLPLANAPETATLGKSDHIDLRVVASGGGLYPIDLFVMALNVEQLPAGVYRYRPKHHALAAVGQAESLPAVRTLGQFGEMEVEKASFLLGYVYKVFENARKYSESGLAFAFIEAGGIAAHVHLGCTALGLGSCDVGSFSSAQLERLFGADGHSRHVIHLTVVGKK